MTEIISHNYAFLLAGTNRSHQAHRRMLQRYSALILHEIIWPLLEKQYLVVVVGAQKYIRVLLKRYYYYYAACNAPCVGHKEDESQAQTVNTKIVSPPQVCTSVWQFCKTIHGVKFPGRSAVRSPSWALLLKPSTVNIDTGRRAVTLCC